MIRQRLRELYEFEPENSKATEKPDEESTNDYVRSITRKLEVSRKELLSIQKRELDQIKGIIEMVDKDVSFSDK